MAVAVDGWQGVGVLELEVGLGHRELKVAPQLVLLSGLVLATAAARP